MPLYDFSVLFENYPDVIAQMSPIFSSHEFIQNLAHRDQVGYIEALSAYSEVRRDRSPAPFMVVHAILSRHLLAYPHLVRYIGKMPSTNIFGHPNRCARWQRVESIPE